MCRALLMTLGICLILFAISGLWMMPKLIQQKIEQRVQLKLGTKNMDRFTKVPIPLTVKFYIFNITNSEQVLAEKEKPIFKEVGPFVYQQWRRRELIDFEDYNRRLRYREYKTFYSLYTGQSTQSTDRPTQDMTQAAQDAPIGLDPRAYNVTIVNLPLLSLLTQLAKLESGSLKRIVAAKVAARLLADGRDKILITKPVNQILFDGYRVDFMESARDLISGTFGFNYQPPLPNNKFGFFYLKNGTWSKRDNGELTIFTGRNDSMDDFMIIDNWNDQKTLSVWPNNTEAGNRCNKIRGTDGSQFHPGVIKGQTLTVFSPFICTSIDLKYLHETQVRDIPLLRYTTSPENFAAPKKSKRNACYCTIPPTQSTSGGNQSAPKITDSRCYLDGLMDMSLCQRGAPIAASSAHFYQGDPILAVAAGLRPNKQLHETYIDVEPMTGSVFRAASRAQLNAFVEEAALDVIDSNIIGRMTPMVAPLMWLEEAAEIDEKSSIEFKGKLLNLVQKARRSFFIALALGIILILLVTVQYCYVTFWAVGADRKRLKRRPNHGSSETQLQANLRLGVGAQKSNLIQSRKGKNLPRLRSDDRMRSSTSAKDDLVSQAVPMIVAATVLGAASAGPSRARPEKLHRAKARTAAGHPSKEDDEELERRLVVNEWHAPLATSSSCRDSSQEPASSKHISDEDQDSEVGGRANETAGQANDLIHRDNGSSRSVSSGEYFGAYRD